MALQFLCSHCGSTIRSRYLKISDEAYCWTCGKRTRVPENHEQVPDDEVDPQITSGMGESGSQSSSAGTMSDVDLLEKWNVGPSVQLYSARAIFWYSLLFSLFAGGVLLAANWRRMGRQDRSTKTLWITGGVQTVLLTLAVIASDNALTTKLFGYLNVAAAFAIRSHVYQVQAPVLNALRAVGRPMASMLRPVIIALAIATPLIGLGIVSMIWEPQLTADEHVQRGTEYLGRGSTDSAAIEFRQAINAAPGYHLGYAAVGLYLLGIEKFDSAAYYLERSLAIKPDEGRYHHNLAIIYAQQERYTDSWREFEIAESLGITVDPVLKDALNEMMGAVDSTSDGSWTR